jgi:hypothetical protein
VKYLLLLHDDATAVAAMSDAERRAIVDEHIGYARMLRERGAHVYSDPLDEPSKARTIRFDGDRAIVTDGPFLEAKESLSGFYVIEASSPDEATELASRVPRSPGLVAELLPIVDM